jgi:hypothetical protein
VANLVLCGVTFVWFLDDDSTSIETSRNIQSDMIMQLSKEICCAFWCLSVAKCVECWCFRRDIYGNSWYWRFINFPFKFYTKLIGFFKIFLSIN